MAAEKAAKPPHPRTPAFRPATSVGEKKKKVDMRKKKYYIQYIIYIALHTTKPDCSSSYTATIHGILPVRFASVL